MEERKLLIEVMRELMEGPEENFETAADTVLPILREDPAYLRAVENSEAATRAVMIDAITRTGKWER